jgi:tetratricopeptide (TPR) repeat protein
VPVSQVSPHLAVLLIVLLSTACGGATPQQPISSNATSNTTALAPVSLPDLSRSEPTVRQQITERYEALQSLIANRAAGRTELAQSYGEVGSLLFAADYTDAAEPFYLHAESAVDSDVRWPYYLGHVYMAKSDAPRAISAFERARRLQPMDVATLVWLGKVYLDRGQPDSAEPLFTQALSIEPSAVAAPFGLGRVALARRDYTRAIEYFERVLAADPRASAAHYQLALAYRGLGDASKADAHLRQRGNLEIGPPDPLMAELRSLLRGASAEEARGMRALNAGDFKTAADHFRRGLEIAPDNASLRHKLGTALAQLGDIRGATEAFEETVRRTPQYAQAHYSLGVMAASTGRLHDATRHFSNAVRYEPSYIEARLRLGEALARTGQFEQALAQFKQVIDSDPRMADARFGYAGALVGLRRYREAREALAEAAALHPDQPRFKEALARLDVRGPSR